MIIVWLSVDIIWYTILENMNTYRYKLIYILTGIYRFDTNRYISVYIDLKQTRIYRYISTLLCLFVRNDNWLVIDGYHWIYAGIYVGIYVNGLNVYTYIDIYYGLYRY